jgi:RNA polymerase sigma factor (sigma-70 family)
MPQDRSFEDLKKGLRTGDKEAASKVFHRYSQRLIALAQRRLEPQIRGKIDPEDVLQSVFRSFFTRQAAGQMEELETWDHLWNTLVLITVRKCRRKLRFFHEPNRDVQREVPGEFPADQSTTVGEPPAEDPTPSEAAILTETVEQLMNTFEGRNREILTLSLQGFSAPEISTRIGCTERTVFRLKARVKEQLEEMYTANNPET